MDDDHGDCAKSTLCPVPSRLVRTILLSFANLVFLCRAPACSVQGPRGARGIERALCFKPRHTRSAAAFELLARS